MARIRSVKPEFWSDEKVGECSMPARLLFIATWNFADDHGGLDRSAKQLKAQAFPYDHVDCEPLIQELLDVGVLIEYQALGKKYLHIRHFRLHQRVDTPSKPRVPPYEGSEGTPRRPPESPPSPSPSSLGGEGTGEGGDKRKGGEVPALVLAAGRPDQPVDPKAHASLPTLAWTMWLEYRRERRLPMGPRALGLHLKCLSAHPPDTQTAMIEMAIANNWKGIFPLRGGAAKTAHKAAPTTAELELLEVSRGRR